MSRTRPLSRRTLLRGAGGVALSLPLLEVMLPARADAATAAPQRFFSWSQPNGTVLDRWAPTAGASATDFTLSEILSPLERHKQDLVVVQNVNQWGSYGHHYNSTLTGWGPLDEGYPKLSARGISMDQVLANAWAGQTPIPSLQLGVMVTDQRDTTSAISWAAAGKALPPENNPYAVFARLFGAGGAAGPDLRLPPAVHPRQRARTGQQRHALARPRGRAGGG